MQTNNPAFSDSVLQHFESYAAPRSTVMTMQGTVAKALVLLAIICGCATFSWIQCSSGSMAPGFLIGSMLGGFIVGLLTTFKPTLAPWTAPVYAVLEGFFLGAVSYFADQRYEGVAFQAILATFGVTFIMLVLYGTRTIQVTGKLAGAVCSATGAIALLYLVAFISSMFGYPFSFLYSSGPIGIAFSVFVVGLAAFNLLLDFDFIEQGPRYNLPKAMEWYAAFGLMVTLVWLYLEVLRLLRKLNDR